MRTKLLIATLLGAVIGASAVFGGFYVKELRRYRAYQRRTAAYDAQEFEPSLFDADELYRLKLVDPSGHDGPSIGDSRNRVIVVNFWAGWCKPCLDEFESFERLSRRTNGKIDFYFLTDDPPDSLKEIARRYELPFFSYGSRNELPPYFRAPELPRTYIIRDGRVLFEHTGTAIWDGSKAAALFEKISDGQG